MCFLGRVEIELACSRRRVGLQILRDCGILKPCGEMAEWLKAPAC
jgi:hypothetical protein